MTPVAGPNPVVIDFIVRGIPNVLKALKSIQDAVTGTEQKSVAAGKAAAAARVRAWEKEAKDAAKAIGQTTSLLGAAQRAGTKEVEKELRARLANQTKHLNAIYDAERTAEAKKTAIRERSASMAGQHAKKQADNERSIRERSASMAGRHAADEAKKEAKAAAKAEAEKRAIRDRSALMAGKYAADQAKAEAKERLKAEKDERSVGLLANKNASTVARQLAVEARKADLEIKRGGAGGSPASSPQARKMLLAGAAGKSPEEQARVLAKVRALREEDQISREHRRKSEAENRKHEEALTKDLEAAEAQRRAIRERSAAMAGKYAAQKSREEAAANKAAEAKSQRTREAFASTVMGAGGKAIQTATSIGGRVANGFLNVGGGFSVEDSLQREVAFQGRAASIAASMSDQIQGIDANTLMSHARATGIREGLDPEEVLKGFDEVKKLEGKGLPMALKMMPHMAEIATATGTDMGHLGGLAANIIASNPDLVKDPNGQKKIERQLRIFTRQGMEGGVEIQDFAKYGSRITAGASLFGGDREANEVTLGAAAQLARQRGGAASAAEATLAAQRFGTDLQKKAGHLKGMGIDVRDGKGTMRSVEDILVDMVKKESDVTKISDFKIGERGNRVLTGVADLYRTAGGGEAGEKAVRAHFANMRKDLGEEEITARAAKRRAAVDKQLEITMIKLRTEVGTKLLPAMIKLIDPVTRLIPYIGKAVDALAQFAEYLAKNPIEGFGLLLGAALGKEIAAAGIKSILERNLTASGGLSVAAAAIAITAATIAVQQMAEAESKRQTENTDNQIRGANALPLLRPGAIKTKDDLAAAKGEAQTLSQYADKQEANKGGSKLWFGTAMVGAGIADAATFGLGGFSKQVATSHKEISAIDEQQVKQTRATLDALNKVIDEASKRIGSTAASAPPGPANPGAPQRNGPIGRRPGG